LRHGSHPSGHRRSITHLLLSDRTLILIPADKDQFRVISNRQIVCSVGQIRATNNPAILAPPPDILFLVSHADPLKVLHGKTTDLRCAKIPDVTSALAAVILLGACLLFCHVLLLSARAVFYRPESIIWNAEFRTLAR
jgi:hypothetical protein